MIFVAFCFSVSACSKEETSVVFIKDEIVSGSPSSYSVAWVSQAGLSIAQLLWPPSKNSLGGLITEYHIYRLSTSSACPASSAAGAQLIKTAGNQIKSLTLAPDLPIFTYEDASASTALNQCYLIAAVGPAGEDFSSSMVLALNANSDLSLTSLGDAIPGGQAKTIQWSFTSESSKEADEFEVAYSLDGENTWTVIDTVPAQNGPLVGQLFSVTWNVPSLNVAAAILKVTYLNSTSGVSSAVMSSSFSIDSEVPVVALSNVAGPVRGGTTRLLTLSASDVLTGIASFKLQYASDGSNFSDVASLTENVSSYNWNVPSDNVSTAKLRLLVTDRVGLSTTVTTDAFTVDSTQPLITWTPPNGAYSGGSSLVLSWTLSETNASATQNFILESSQDAGTTWSALTTVAAAAGPLVNQAFSYTWTVPSWNSSQVKMRITYSDLAGHSATVTSGEFMVDSVAPVLAAAEMSINAGAASTNNNYVQLSLKATDNLTVISHFCLKYNDSTTPTLNSICWVPVNAPSPGLLPSQNLELINFPYQIGLGPAVYTVYAWTRDLAGNISTLSAAGNGTQGQDKDSIEYQPGAPPTVINVSVSSTDAPATPPSGADLTVPMGSSVVIKWNASDDSALPAAPVSIYYTLNDSDYVLIADSVPNSQGAGCTVVVGTHTGCMVWTNTVTDAYLKLRVRVTDASSMSSSSSSSPLNVLPPINFLAGNTDPGLGGSATSAVFFNDLTSNSAVSDPNTLVVAQNGRIYFRDYRRGLIMVDPSDGIQRILIPKTGTHVDGNVAAAQLYRGDKILLDYNNNVWIYDFDRIKKLDTSANPMTLTTVIGGGTSFLANLSNPRDLKIVSQNFANALRRMPFLVLPNGDLFFQSDLYEVANTRLRRYHADTGQISSIYLTGVGDSSSPTRIIQNCMVRNIGMTFDPLDPTNLNFYATVGGLTGCSSSAWAGVRFNSEGVATSPHPVLADHALVNSRSGELISINRGSGVVARHVPANQTWMADIGAGTPGTCADGVAKNSCPIDPQDVFVTAQGRLYLMDRGRIRVVDDQNRLQTVFGQPFYFGDGGHPLSARFNVINDVEIWNNGATDKMIILDALESRFREFAVHGTIQTIAGNGLNSVQVLNVDPKTTPLMTMSAGLFWDSFKVNPATGDIFYHRGPPNVAKLNRTLNQWQIVAGAAVGTNYYEADGMLGTSIKLGSYPPLMIGFDGSNLLATVYRYATPNWYDSMTKLYSISDGTQTHLAGVLGIVSGGICDSGLTAICNHPLGSTTNFTKWQWDSFGSRWIQVSMGGQEVRVLKTGENVSSLTGFASPASSFAYRRNADLSTHIIYYCNTVDGRIWKKDLNGVEASLPWPITSMRCTGRSLVWSTSRNSLIFPYIQNNLYGIAEYLAP